MCPQMAKREVVLSLKLVKAFLYPKKRLPPTARNPNSQRKWEQRASSLVEAAFT